MSEQSTPQILYKGQKLDDLTKDELIQAVGQLLEARRTAKEYFTKQIETCGNGKYCSPACQYITFNARSCTGVFCALFCMHLAIELEGIVRYDHCRKV